MFNQIFELQSQFNKQRDKIANDNQFCISYSIQIRKSKISDFIFYLSRERTTLYLSYLLLSPNLLSQAVQNRDFLDYYICLPRRVCTSQQKLRCFANKENVFMLDFTGPTIVYVFQVSFKIFLVYLRTNFRNT